MVEKPNQAAIFQYRLIAKYRSLFVFVFLFFLVIVDLEVAELIRVLGGGNNAQPVSQVVLLQVLLGEILQVTLAEGHSRGKDNLVLVTTQGHVFTKVSGLASNLKVVKVLRHAWSSAQIQNPLCTLMRSLR